MRWVTRDPDEKGLAAERRKEFEAACAERDKLPESERGTFDSEAAKAGADWDAHTTWPGRSERYIAAQDKVEAAMEAMRRAEKSYFRLNIWGMGRYRDLMERLGMVFEDDPHPPFPKYADYGTDADDADAAENPEYYPGHQWTDERLRNALKYREAVNAVLAFHGRADTPGIPLHKFGSNDGWHVLPAECEAAVRAWQQFVKDEGEEAALNFVDNGVNGSGYWLEWIAYLAGAARHGGFRVY